MDEVSEIILRALSENRKSLFQSEVGIICQTYHIPFVSSELASNEEEAVRCARNLGFPVALKVASPDILHKSDVGGVVLDLRSPSEVHQAYRRIVSNARASRPEARMSGVTVQKMVPHSIEVIVGAIRDDQFGPSIMFGLGGILVEILEDIALRIAPVTRQEARLMISEIKAYPVLKGYRNKPAADIDALASIIVNTSRLVEDYEGIMELDLNPVLVQEKGAKAVDARIILE